MLNSLIVMNRIVSIILLALFYFQGVAYATPSEEEQKQWELLVDYVNCMYVKAYIEDRVSKNPNSQDTRLYEENIRPFLDRVDVSAENQRVSISGVLSHEKLSDLLINNQWKTTNDKLAAVINQRKVSVHLFNFDSLIMISNFSQEMQDCLNQEHDRMAVFFSGLQNVTPPTSAEPIVEDSSEKNISKSEESSNIWMWIAIPFIVLFLLTLAMFLYFYFCVYKQMVARKKHYKSECATLKQSLEAKMNEVVNLEKEKIKYIEEIKSLKESQKSNNVVAEEASKPVEPLLHKEEPQQTKEIVKYFQYPNSNLEVNALYEKESPNFYYKAVLENDTKARFEFCGKSEKAINNSDSYLANACEYKDIPANASRIITDVQGVIVLQGNTWRVEKKAQIHFS